MFIEGCFQAASKKTPIVEIVSITMGSIVLIGFLILLLGKLIITAYVRLVLHQYLPKIFNVEASNPRQNENRNNI